MRDHVGLCLLAGLGVAWMAASGSAQPPEKSFVQKGVVIGVVKGELEMTGVTANRILYTFSVDKDASITCDGKNCKLEDLKRGMEAEVTATRQQGKSVATKIVAKKVPMK